MTVEWGRFKKREKGEACCFLHPAVWYQQHSPRQNKTNTNNINKRKKKKKNLSLSLFLKPHPLAVVQISRGIWGEVLIGEEGTRRLLFRVFCNGHALSISPLRCSGSLLTSFFSYPFVQTFCFTSKETFLFCSGWDLLCGAVLPCSWDQPRVGVSVLFWCQHNGTHRWQRQRHCNCNAGSLFLF